MTKHSLKQWTHLVALHPPDLENPRHCLQQLKLVFPEENGTAVRSIIALYVQTRRVGFREEHAVVTLRAQDGFEEIEVIHFLKNPVCDIRLQLTLLAFPAAFNTLFNSDFTGQFIYRLFIDAVNFFSFILRCCHGSGVP